MTAVRQPKCPNTLEKKSISEETRLNLNIPDYIMISDFDKWEVNSFINDYFLFEESPSLTGHTLYNDTDQFLKAFIESPNGNKTEKNYTKKFLAYFQQTVIKKQFLEHYKKVERQQRIKTSEIEVEEEVQIASNELVEDHLRDRREKRKLADITNNEHTKSLKVRVNKKDYTIQSPSTSVEADIPVVSNGNIEILQPRLDLCFGTNTNHATPELLEQYQEIQKKHRQGFHLSSVVGAKELFDKLIALNKHTFLDEIAAAKYHKSAFNQFLKFSMIDFGVNTLRPSSMPVNDERTMFVEVVVQLWKYFGNITGLIAFRWCERKDKDAATAIFFANQEKVDTNLLDGIGVSKKKTTNFVIESSGLNDTTNIEHTLEDSMKNIKSATDALVNIMCRYPNASITTMKRVHVYSIHIIQTKMTAVQYSWKDKKTWTALECGSALLPVTFEERRGLVQVYDLFAFIYNDLLEQEKVLSLLDDENLGLEEVSDEELICNHSL